MKNNIEMRTRLIPYRGKSVVAALLVMLLFTTLTACGQKGPLQRPEPNTPAQVASDSRVPS